MPFTHPAFHVAAAPTKEAQAAAAQLAMRYPLVPWAAADVIVALGGDGFLLECLHHVLGDGGHQPIFSMNRGSVGFLLNEYQDAHLPDRIASAQKVVLHPLRMRAGHADGSVVEALAFNEVSLLRQSRQAAKLRIAVDGVVRLEELSCDGALLSTPAGSTAYNLSAHGPILPLGSQTLALTPISAFRPRRWRGAVLPAHAKVRFDVLEADKRPVSAVADFTEVRDSLWVEIAEDRGLEGRLLFDPELNLEERILKEQFAP